MKMFFQSVRNYFKEAVPNKSEILELGPHAVWLIPAAIISNFIIGPIYWIFFHWWLEIVFPGWGENGGI